MIILPLPRDTIRSKRIRLTTYNFTQTKQQQNHHQNRSPTNLQANLPFLVFRQKSYLYSLQHYPRLHHTLSHQN